MRFSLPSIKCLAGPTTGPTTGPSTTAELCSLSELCTTIDLITALGSSRKLGEAAEHLIDGSEKRICR